MSGRFQAERLGTEHEAEETYDRGDHPYVKDLSAAQIEEIIRKPENEWTMTPKKFMAFATFMKQTGLISTQPSDWRELFFRGHQENAR